MDQTPQDEFKLGPALCFSIFVVLALFKVTGVLNCSWGYITAPLWIPLGIYAICWAVLGLALLWLSYIVKEDDIIEYEDNDKENGDKDNGRQQ